MGSSGKVFLYDISMINTAFGPHNHLFLKIRKQYSFKNPIHFSLSHFLQLLFFQDENCFRDSKRYMFILKGKIAPTIP